MQIMKKLLCLMLALILLFSLAACKKGSSVPASDEVTARAAFTVPDSWVKTDRSGVYKLDKSFEFPQSGSGTISVKNGVILYDFIIPDINTSVDNVVLFDVADGTETFRKTFDDNKARKIGQLSGGGFYELLTDNAFIKRYSSSGNADNGTKAADVEKITDGLVSPDGDRILYQKIDQGRLGIYDINSRQAIAVNGDVASGFFLGADNTGFYLRGLKNQLWKIDYSGTPSVISSRINAHLSLPYITECNESGYIVQNLATNSLLSFAADTDKEVIEAAGAGCIMAQSDDGLRLYNLDKGKYSDIIPLDGAYMSAAFSEDGYYAVLTAKDGKYFTTMLLVSEIDFNNSFSAEGASYDDFESINFDKRAVDSATEQCLKSIYEKYNVRVILKSTKFEENICGYTCKEITDSDIPSKVKSVEHFLSLLPDGMTNEIYNGMTVWVYLCNDLNSIDTNDHVAGFASLFSGHPFTAVESTGKDIYFEETLAHEFSHLFDYAISAEWLNGWEKLSPDDAYRLSMSNLPGKYTPFGMDGSDIYFVDIYSTTFPTEDRAVIFQKLFYEYASGDTTTDLHHKNVETKVDYYAKMLRANFPSCEKATDLFWEKFSSKGND